MKETKLDALFSSHRSQWGWNDKPTGADIFMVNCSALLPAMYLYAKHLMLEFAQRCVNVQIMKGYITEDSSWCNGAERV